MTHEHWSNYWQSGMQTSLPQDFKHNYDGEIAKFWHENIESLPDGARILDLCTGNGAVALLIAGIAEQLNKQLIITAVDISQINIDFIRKNNPSSQTEMIRFISGQSAETIDQCIKQPQDLVVSQFGIEYSDLNLTAAALANIIKPQGRLIFIAHSVDSAVFKYMSNEELIYQWLQRVGLLPLFHRFVTDDIDEEGLVRDINKIIAENQPEASFQGQPLFISWLQLIGQIRQSSVAQIKSQKEAIIYFVNQHHAARKRQQDMLHVVKKISDDKWLQPILDYGFESIESKELNYKNQHHIGTSYSFLKN